MTRHSDQKKAEHAKYAEEHSLKRSHQEEISNLKEKNQKLEKRVAKLESELKLYRNK